MRHSTLLSGIALSATALAGVVDRTVSNAREENSPCAAIAAIVEEEAAATFAPSLAFRCLESIPLQAELASAYIDYILPYLQFESNLNELANPPETYLLPGVDLIGGYNTIRTNVENGDYNNMWEFAADVARTSRRAADGHFNLELNLSGLFAFVRANAFLISVSEDGLSVPQVYSQSDLLRIRAGETFEPSPIATVDGIDAYDYFSQIAAISLQQDPDAQWNDVFYSAARAGRGEGFGLWVNPPSYYDIADETTIEFVNGSLWTIENIAVLSGRFVDWAGIVTGQDLFDAIEEQFSNPAIFSLASDATDTSNDTDTSDDLPPIEPLTGYPYPVDIHRYGGMFSGYFLNESDYTDVGVLALNGFFPPGGDPSNGERDVFEGFRFFQSYFTQFVEQGKTRLVIDLSENGGGYGALAMFLFRFIFPEDKPYDTYRLRASDVTEFLVENLFGLEDGIRPDILRSIFIANSSLTSEDLDVPYKSADDLFGPVNFRGDEYTNEIAASTFNLLSTLFEDPEIPDLGSIVPAGYFRDEDIILLTDGVCASACPFFVRFMTQTHPGVRTITIGGRPIQEPMQPMGGTRGGEVLTLDNWREGIAAAINVSQGAIPEGLVLPDIGEPPISTAIFRINHQNIYRLDDETGIPLHYSYEPSYCRLFYTIETGFDVVRLWETVSDVAWSDAELCVPGSTTNENGTIGTTLPEFSTAVYANPQLYPVVPGGYDTVGARNNEKRDLVPMPKRKGLDRTHFTIIDNIPMPDHKGNDWMIA